VYRALRDTGLSTFPSESSGKAFKPGEEEESSEELAGKMLGCWKKKCIPSKKDAAAALMALDPLSASLQTPTCPSLLLAKKTQKHEA
jgi:hypothetical protein